MAQSWLSLLLTPSYDISSQEEEARRKDDEDDAAFSSSFWYEMKEHTYNCLECMDKYMDAKKEVISFLVATSSSSEGEDHLAETARLKLDTLDRRFLEKQLMAANQALVQGSALPNSFVFALFDLLANYLILEDPIINQT